MGLTEFFSDIMSSLSFTEVHAEAKEESEDQDEDQSEESEKKEGEEGGEEKKEEGGDGEEQQQQEEGGGNEAEAEAEEEAEEEEEEEEEEPEDIKPKLEEGKGSSINAGLCPCEHLATELDYSTECSRSAQCAPLKHHFDDCVERVTAAHESDEPHKAKGEDCVEECELLLLLHVQEARVLFW